MSEDFINDPTLSKRPIRIYNTASHAEEIHGLQEQQKHVESVIEKLELLIDAKESDVNYKKVLESSKDRLITIALRRMSVPVGPDTLYQHAEIVGQFNERLLITKELMDDKRELEKQQGFLSNLCKKIEELWKQTKKG